MFPIPITFVACYHLMRQLILGLSAMILLMGCGKATDVDTWHKKADSLAVQVMQMRPGLGEYMLSVQMHHNKLWYAGNSADWELAGFEIGEIKEQLEHARLVCTDRPEIKTLPMIDPFVSGLEKSVKQKDTAAFKRTFIELTANCNACHKSVHFDFIRIKVPDQPMFTNQYW